MQQILVLVVDQSTGDVKGSARLNYADDQGRLLDLTPPPDGTEYVGMVVDEKGVPTDPLFAACLDSVEWPNSGPPRWRWSRAQSWTSYAFGDAADLVEVPDPRFPVRVTQTPNPGLVGQPLTVKLEVLKPNGDPRTNLNRQATVGLLDQNGRLRRVALNIVAGVAERTFTPGESGELKLVSDTSQVVFQGDNPVVIDEAW